ncbi:MAG: STAS domain-containing protein [Cyanobacteria bacterium P01_H01_bin.121]
MTPVINVVQHPGILDSTTADNFLQAIDTAAQSNPDILLFDMSETSFIDSSGLGTIVSVMKQVRERNVAFYVCSPNAQVKIVFDLSNIHQAFPIFENRDAFEQAVLQQA